MKMKQWVLVTLTAFALSACVTTELPTAKRDYNPSQDARVRLYGQNGRPTTMLLRVEGKPTKVTIGGGLGQAFGSMLGVKGNESIGMPETPLSKNPSAHSKFLSGIFFKEFIVPAGVPISVHNHIISLGNINVAAQQAGVSVIKNISSSVSCESNHVGFTPEAGKDYEVAPISSGRNCGVTVYEIE